ncbi:cytochrome P450 [Nocardiopsis dassonvillei]
MADSALSGFPEPIRSTLEPVRAWALYSDPPTHSRLRRLLSRALAPLNSPALADSVRVNARHLINSLLRRGIGDAVGEIAIPLPVATISELLGLPVSDRGLLKAWSDDLIAIIEPELTPAQISRVHRAWTDLWDYFGEIVDQRRTSPGEDAVSWLVTGREQGAGMSHQELVSNCVSLLLGGHETTTALLASLLFELGGRPDVRAQLTRTPDLIPGFVEEILRTNGPSKITAREARKDVQVGGHAIAAGQRVVLLLSAASRDLDAFDAPETFTPRRHPNPHLGFGHGAHACFGAALARLQARILTEEFLSQGHDLDVDTESVIWKQSQVLRSASRLTLGRDLR